MIGILTQYNCELLRYENKCKKVNMSLELFMLVSDCVLLHISKTKNTKIVCNKFYVYW